MVGRRRAWLLCLALVGVIGAGCSASSPHAAPTTSSTQPSSNAGRSGDAGSSSSTPETPSAPVQPIHWTTCDAASGPKGYQCATIAVPRNPDDPAMGTIQMAIDRHVASGTRIGSLVINPGGPGESGVDYLPDAMSTLGSDLIDHFDLVGFDPPGVARSAPIVCADSAGLTRYFHVDPSPIDAAGVATLLASDRAFAAGCQTRSGSELPYVSTVDAAKDLDVLRADLGDEKLTYMGFSYGTLLGAQYASLFPNHVRALVLDGAIDPAVPTLSGLEQQSASLDAQLQQFFVACGSSKSCSWNPPGGRVQAYQALVAKVRVKPLPAKGTDRTVGPAELLFGTAAALYSPASWNFLGSALAQAEGGDGSEILQLFDAYTGRRSDGTYGNIFEANAAVNCLDTPAPSLSAIESAIPHAAAVAPVFGAANVYDEMVCDVWPVKATGKVGPLRAPGSAPIVVIGSTGDPVTPYSWAQGLASELGSGVLLTRVGDGHTGYQFSSCIRKATDAYLIDLQVPARGTRCASS